MSLQVRPMDEFRTAGQINGPSAIGGAIRGVLAHSRQLGLVDRQVIGQGQQARQTADYKSGLDADLRASYGAQPTPEFIQGTGDNKGREGVMNWSLNNATGKYEQKLTEKSGGNAFNIFGDGGVNTNPETAETSFDAALREIAAEELPSAIQAEMLRRQRLSGGV